MTLAALSPSPAGVPALEEWIRSHGSSFELTSIALGSINETKSLANQARFKALDEDTVLIYATAMERGDQFPPIVVYKERGSFVVIDGNHRVAAARLAGKATLGAYVLGSVTELQVQTMTFEANAKHGLPSSVEERIAHGLYLVDLGVQHKEAASMVNVPLQTLQKAIDRHRADTRFGNLGIERWTSIAQSSRQRMNAIRSDVVFTAAARLVIEAKLSHDAVGQLVTTINKASSEADQLGVVEEARTAAEARIVVTAGGRLKLPISFQRLSRSVAYTEGVDPTELRAAVSTMTPEQRSVFSSRINRAVLVLMEAKRVLGSE